MSHAFAARLLPVTKVIADCWAVLGAQAQRRGIALANIDGLIAATAVSHGLTLVTRNVKNFAGVEVIVLNPGKSEGLALTDSGRGRRFRR